MDCNEIRTRNHLLCKRTLKHLAKLAKTENTECRIHSKTRSWHDKNAQSMEWSL